VVPLGSLRLISPSICSNTVASTQGLTLVHF
jgi:hypothetical protein